MSTKTKKDLIQHIASKTGEHPVKVRAIVQAFLDGMTDELITGNRLEFRDFGVFEIVVRKQKIGRNPKNADVAIVIPARRVVKFTSGKKIKEMVEKSVPTTASYASKMANAG